MPPRTESVALFVQRASRRWRSAFVVMVLITAAYVLWGPRELFSTLLRGLLVGACAGVLWACARAALEAATSASRQSDANAGAKTLDTAEPAEVETTAYALHARGRKRAQTRLPAIRGEGQAELTRPGQLPQSGAAGVATGGAPDGSDALGAGMDAARSGLAERVAPSAHGATRAADGVEIRMPSTAANQGAIHLELERGTSPTVTGSTLRGVQPVESSSKVRPSTSTSTALAAPLVRETPVPSTWSLPATLGPKRSWPKLEELLYQLTLLIERGPCVVGVSSTSFDRPLKARLATQLAWLLSEELQFRVLLVEADFEQPVVERELDIEMPPLLGFSQQLYHRVHARTPAHAPWTIVRCTPRLSVLAEGRVRTPAMLQTVQFTEAFSELREQYGFVVIHGPVAGQTVACRTLAAVTDSILIAAASDASIQEKHEHAAQLFKDKRLLAVVPTPAP